MAKIINETRQLVYRERNKRREEEEKERKRAIYIYPTKSLHRAKVNGQKTRDFTLSLFLCKLMKAKNKKPTTPQKYNYENLHLKCIN